MPKLPRLVSVMVLFIGLIALLIALGVPARVAHTAAALDANPAVTVRWQDQLDAHTLPVALWSRMAAGHPDVPAWLQVVLKQLSTWLDGLIDVAAGLVAEPASTSGPAIAAADSGTVPASHTVESVEASLIAQTNAARETAGLPPLHADAALTALARQRSQDMIDRNYFSHHDPETGESMILPYCIQPLATNLCGENLAASSNLTDVQANVVARWIASEGHRANIMRAEFGRVGIGIAAGGKWGYVVTQLFAP